jgi:iron complex outermembrane receptor protein
MQLAQPRLNQPFSGTAGTSYYAASQGITSYAILEGGTATGAMRLSTTYRNHNNYRAGNGAVIAYTQYEKLNVTLAGKWALKPGDTLMADVLADYGWNIGFPALPMDVGLAKTWVAGITLEQSRPEAFFNAWKTKLYANHVYHEMDDSQRENVVMPMDMPGQTATIGFYTEGQAKPKGKHRMNMRADGYYTYALAEMTMYAEGESPMYMQTWPESGRVVAGIFAEDHIQMNSETEATLNTRLDWAGTQLFEGIGIDQLRIFYSDLQPFDQRFSVSVNASVSRYVSRDVRVGLQTGYAQRIPTLSEYAGFYLFNSMDGYDYVGNPYLKNEQSLMLGVNANYLRGPVEADVNFFTQRLPDYIFSYTDSQLSPMTPGAAGVRVYQNVPYAHFTGAEAMITWKISSHFSLLDQVNLVMARLHNDQAVPLIPPLRNQLSVQYHSGNWVAQADLDAAVAQNQVNSSYGEDPTPAYAVMNAFVEYSGLAGWQFRFGVDNVLDATYYTHLDWGNVLRPGRNLYASVRFRW